MCVCVFVHWHCSAQLNMVNMEKRYRNQIIITGHYGIVTMMVVMLMSSKW